MTSEQLDELERLARTSGRKLHPDKALALIARVRELEELPTTPAALDVSLTREQAEAKLAKWPTKERQRIIDTLYGA